MKLRFLLLSLFFATAMFAQNGTVTGTILDKEFNNEPLAFANIVIKGTKQGTSTDENGKYSISLKPGNYTIVIGYLGYETKEIAFTIKANEKKVINHTLVASGVQLQDIEIVHIVSKEKESALLQEQQKAVEIKQSIGAEEISKKGIGDVAAAVAKTSGISKQEGSSDIYVRGLGDRYNSTTMNGLPLPSNNPSTKNMSLDVFSTDIVEYIGIDKTFNYKNYGDFAGANVDIVSKTYRGSGMVEVGTGTGFNSNAISQNKFYLQDGPNFHGFSNQAIPSNPLAGYNFTTSWDKQAVTPVNGSFYLRGGDSYGIGNNGKLSFFVNASFDNGYTYKEGARRGSVNTQAIAGKDFFRQSYEYSTGSNAMANINYKINSNHNIKFNSMYINSTSQKHEEFTGIIDIFDAAPNGGGFVRRSTFERTSLLINQLLGNHTLGNRTNFDWGVSYNMMSNVIPDRMQNTFVPLDNDNPNVSPLIVSNLNKSDNHRYFQDMTDDELAGNFTLTYKFGKREDDTFKGKLIAGYSGRYKEINFDATQFNFKINSQEIIDINNIDGYFNQNSFNLGYFDIQTFRGGLSVPNALSPQNYNGQQIISAGFGAIEYQFTPKLFVIAGFRSEYIIQDIFYSTSLKTGKKLTDTVEYLPSLTAKYEVSEKQNIKFAASKTYTLPQFKERAPFLFEEVGQSYFGNENLYNSTDYNFDLKWEMFPKNGEVLSFTGFGKYIQNPINQVTVASATNDISWVNSGEKAIGLGIEGEWRKSIISKENITTGEKTNLGFGLNVSYLYTNQDLDTQKVIVENPGISVAFTNQESRLSGASDLLINSDLSFNKEFKNDKSLTATLAGGYFSDRIYALGVTGKGDLVDSEVITVDFILKFNLSKNIGIGFSAKNLTDPTIERKQDIQDIVVDSYKKGRNFSLSMKYSF
ncbi:MULTISPECIES: TonB-dependent receptor [unclassified Flavobacterium]|uniref:TonB-dependent receptor n=1 Tax=unclassified Flavobacterium TaxID=196869 RepID=UPI001291DB69|nr:MULTISPECIES: TonB-dependent receptor [unclassified Flavobacterium]MQP51273.1 TonB-dependent receptor plug domain-containing protein [Flavobacterium sp. LMO9]MQP61498.1 TonB-dependent receptor plug domain-containing protein [Flavobacterium sp. LMO6]